MRKTLYKKVNSEEHHIKPGYKIIRSLNKISIISKSVNEIKRLNNNLSKFLEMRGLIPKTTEKYYNKQLDYIELYFWSLVKTNSGKFQLKLRLDTIRKYRRNIKVIIKRNIDKPVYELIKKLNYRISHWMNKVKLEGLYTNDIEHLDIYIYKLLWKWSRKRHPRRPNTWIYNKYWKKILGSWKFFGINNNNGTIILLRSHNTSRNFSSSTVSCLFNPFLIINKEKLDQIQYNRLKYTTSGLFGVIWKKQIGKCYYCKRILDPLQISENIIKRLDKNYKIENPRYIVTHRHCC